MNEHAHVYRRLICIKLTININNRISQQFGDIKKFCENNCYLGDNLFSFCCFTTSVRFCGDTDCMKI